MAVELGTPQLGRWDIMQLRDLAVAAALPREFLPPLNCQPKPQHDAFVIGKVCWGEGFVYMLSDPLLNDFADFIKRVGLYSTSSM